MSKPVLARIGCAGWNIPRGSADGFPLEGTHLARYSRVFNCVEINSSFYRDHKSSTWDRWRESVPANFQFSVKAPRAITHETKLKCGGERLLQFLEQAAILGQKLGPILFQLPPSLELERDAAVRFLTILRQHFAGDVVWEPRHRSWFETNASELLSSFKIARVAADPACVVAAADPGAAKALVYFRLHGSPRLYYSAYNLDYLQKLAKRLAEFEANARVWCVFDNTASGAATRNALDLIHELST